MNKDLHWRQHFIEAFWRIHDRGMKPTPTLINIELRRWGLVNVDNLNGRETKLRTQLMLEAGYKKTGQYGRWILES